ncbi:hypothetical protein Btru_055303 [Bulinus truncatus]|nr:hypothetical protein Btru_055303 [Bulinus truncatus]
MTEHINDNNPIVDNVTFITFDEQTTGLETEGEEDFFICRKCNRIFKNLPQYLEHKIKDENYRLVQTRSSMDRRLILPKLVPKKYMQKKKSRLAEEEHSQVPLQGSLNVESPKQQTTGDKVMAVKESEAEESDRIVLNSETHVSGPKKRGRKKKTQLADKPTRPVIQLSTDFYACKKCEKKFRREASLRWHMTYEHDSKTNKEEDSESSDDEMDKEEHDVNDVDYEVASPVKGNKDHLAMTGVDKNETNICVIIEQPLKEYKSSENGEEQFLDKQTEIEDIKFNEKVEFEELKGDSQDRPFVCNICGRSFKESTVLKAHGIIHSDERKFICKYENCPYGFKTKGGLVRHERRHTGERPFVCERCNRAFSEAGALARHLKARRNCSETPDSAYPRYMKSWTYHPNIPAVLDPTQRDSQKGRNTLPLSGGSLQPELSLDGNEEVHFIITDVSDPKVISDGIIAPKLESILPHLVTAEILGSEGKVDSKLEIKLETEGLETKREVAYQLVRRPNVKWRINWPVDSIVQSSVSEVSTDLRSNVKVAYQLVSRSNVKVAYQLVRRPNVKWRINWFVDQT